MAEGTLLIGTKRYSSWSLRGWLSVRLAGLTVNEEVVPLGQDETAGLIESFSPAARVPALRHQETLIWDSLAIAEYCAELSVDLWPEDRKARAVARSVCAEMHSGFQALRRDLPMNLGRIARPRATPPSEELLGDIARVEALWTQTRARFGSEGPFLFGAAFGNTDAFYAPVVSRFLSYGIETGPVARDYMQAVREHTLVEAWYEAAAAEPESWRLDRYESVD
ncbi:glutathione S-transferase family protein [Acetobacter sp. AN02]|uniref:glutathione S-transferase family protein n=1 Tax=Acetobacter sp. AN02 TaxID=2894186 RepID=UPI0024344F0F|nr:glutathione S-transferase family protein [Acetobacter sp. AN02]MDG6095372.1 glutathione S-transferase family protein [Acetobacter sp. AN02]